MCALRKIDGLLRRLAGKTGGRLLVALAFSLLLVAAACFIETPTYYENDDSNIAFALAGYRSGEPFPTHPFINCLLGFAVSGLYRLLPSVSWWTVCQLLTVVWSVAAVCASALKLACRRRVPVLAVLAGVGVWYAGLVFYATALLTFTLTSAAAGSAATALVLSSEDGDAPGLGRVRNVLSCAFLVLSFLFRNSGGLCMLCFYLGALAFRLVRQLFAKDAEKRGRLIRTCALGGAVLTLSACLVAVNAWGLMRYNADGFRTFDNNRSEFLDYPHDTYGENPELYASVGWDQALYAMMEKWYFMDARINAETLGAIREGSRVQSLSSREAWTQAVRVAAGQEPAAYQAAMPALALLLTLALFLQNRRRAWLPFLFACAMLCGTAVLAAYLCLRGRFLLRTLQLLIMPATAAILLLGLWCLPDAGMETLKKRKWVGLPAAFLALAMCFPAYKSARVVAGYDSEALLAESRAVVSYALARPENVYIRDTYVGNNYDAWTTYPSEKPVNLMDWGGTNTMTGFWQLQLQANGITSFTAEAFLGDNVYYIGNPDGPEKTLFETYLGTVLGAGARLETVDSITEQAAVYRVRTQP